MLYSLIAKGFHCRFRLRCYANYKVTLDLQVSPSIVLPFHRVGANLMSGRISTSSIGTRGGGG